MYTNGCRNTGIGTSRSRDVFTWRCVAALLEIGSVKSFSDRRLTQLVACPERILVHVGGGRLEVWQRTLSLGHPTTPLPEGSRMSWVVVTVRVKVNHE